MRTRRYTTGNYARAPRPIGRVGDPEPRIGYCAGIAFQLPKSLLEPAPMETAETILGMLADLENVLAEAEEIRYRIFCTVRCSDPAAIPAPQKKPVPPLPAPEPEPAAPTLDTTGLVKSGRGLWAWAKEHSYADELIELGKAAAFPARMVDWSREQVESAVEALALMITHPKPAVAAPRSVAPRAPEAPRPSRKRRRREPGDDDPTARYEPDDDLPY